MILPLGVPFELRAVEVNLPQIAGGQHRIAGQFTLNREVPGVIRRGLIGGTDVIPDRRSYYSLENDSLKKALRHFREHRPPAVVSGADVYLELLL
jgi:hypothetical protein